jgi:hypothetical protein
MWTIVTGVKFFLFMLWKVCLYDKDVAFLLCYWNFVKFIPLGAGYTQQAHPREIPEAER